MRAKELLQGHRLLQGSEGSLAFQRFRSKNHRRDRGQAQSAIPRRTLFERDDRTTKSATVVSQIDGQTPELDRLSQREDFRREEQLLHDPNAGLQQDLMRATVLFGPRSANGIMVDADRANLLLDQPFGP